MRKYQKSHKRSDSQQEAPQRLTHSFSLLLALVIMVAPMLITTAAEADDDRESGSTLDYRYPADTSGPGLRLLSLLHDTKGKNFEQGVVKPKDRKKKNYFVRPRSVALGHDGQIYTLDGARGVVFEMTYSDGSLQKSQRLPDGNRSFLSPIDIAVAPDGSVWLTDSRHKAVFIIDATGKKVDTLTGMFERPIGVVFHKESNHMLVTDLAKNTILEVTLDHKIAKTHGASDSKSGDSTDKVNVGGAIKEDATAERIIVEGPSFIAVGSTGNIYVVEALGGTVAIFTPDWKLLRRLGGFGDGPGFFSKPKGIAVDKAGRVYVADALFDNIQVFDERDRLLLTLGSNGNAPGQFVQPMGIAIDDSGAIYIADSYNGRVQVFRWENIGK